MKKLLLLIMLTFTLGSSPAGAYYANSFDEQDDPCIEHILRLDELLAELDQIRPPLTDEKIAKINRLKKQLKATRYLINRCYYSWEYFSEKISKEEKEANQIQSMP